ncbi:MAG: hypothetical protein NC124_04310 [Clostridium sp.]|nr:hypothetical protein [Clostridium sp.]
MAVVNARFKLPFSIEVMWDVLTSLENYSWRSDLVRIEIINEKQFIQYTSGGDAITCTVVQEIKYRHWEFEMENEDMKGRWACMLFSWGEKRTEINLAEEIVVKKFYLMPFVNSYLNRRHITYVKDLTRLSMDMREEEKRLAGKTMKE